MNKLLYLLPLLLLIFPFITAQEYYECAVSATVEVGRDVEYINGKAQLIQDSPCLEYRGRVHKCQLPNDYEFSEELPKECDKCLKRSKMPKECVQVTVQPTTNLEWHEKKRNHRAPPQLVAEKEDCNEYEKWKRGACVLRTEDECEDFELWDTEKCELRCDIDLDWNGVECVDPEDPYGLLNMSVNTQKIVQDTKKNVGVIRHANGAYVFTTDGKNYFATPEEAKSPGLMKGTFAAWMSWGKNAFFGGKSTDKDQKLMEEVADILLKEIKEQPRNQESATKKLERSVAKSIMKEGAKALVGPIAKGITIPTDAIEMLAQRGAEVEFEADIVEYSKLRQTMDMNSIKNDADTIQDLSTTQLFANEEDMFEAFEVAYQRFVMAKALQKN